jgi:hypothetical protein
MNWETLILRGSCKTGKIYFIGRIEKCFENVNKIKP